MIDKTAIIDQNAKVHQTAKIGPYVVIGPNVEIGENVKIYSHVSIVGNTKIGKGNVFYPFASIGNDPQDLKYNGEKTLLEIGDNNRFREYVTINPGTIGGGGLTKIGNNCFISLSLSEIYLQLEHLRNSPQPEQRTQEWYEMRESMLTASDFYKALGSQVSIDNYAISKVLPRESKSSHSNACQHGILFEPVCKLFYESMFPVEVEEFGLLRHSIHSFIGASPDGICNEKSDKSFIGRLVEFKAPYSRKIIRGYVPESYLIQIQGQLEVTNLSKCDYLECDFELFDINPDETDDVNYIAKGIIIKYWKDSQECYYYGDINSMTIPNNYSKPYKVLYWILKDFNIVTIKRNSYWFSEYLLPALSFTWNRTLWFRKNPKELTCKLKTKNNKKIKSNNQTINMFL